MDQDERDYFARRERAERAAAKSATCAAARRAHQELAQTYHELANAPPPGRISVPPRMLRIVRAAERPQETVSGRPS